MQNDTRPKVLYVEHNAYLKKAPDLYQALGKILSKKFDLHRLKGFGQTTVWKIQTSALANEPFEALLIHVPSRTSARYRKCLDTISSVRKCDAQIPIVGHTCREADLFSRIELAEWSDGIVSTSKDPSKDAKLITQILESRRGSHTLRRQVSNPQLRIEAGIIRIRTTVNLAFGLEELAISYIAIWCVDNGISAKISHLHPNEEAQRVSVSLDDLMGMLSLSLKSGSLVDIAVCGQEKRHIQVAKTLYWALSASYAGELRQILETTKLSET